MESAFIDLLNSNWSDWRASRQSEDRLDQPAWIEDFLGKWGLIPNRLVHSEIAPALKDLRALIGRVVQAVHNGEAPSEPDLDRLNKILAGVPFRHRLFYDEAFSPVPHATEFDPQEPAERLWRLEPEPVVRNTDWVLSEIVVSLAKVLTAGEPRRLKICLNPACRWVFYDESRGMTRKWCESQTCGNLMKVRSFRARHKTGKAAKD